MKKDKTAGWNNKFSAKQMITGRWTGCFLLFLFFLASFTWFFFFGKAIFFYQENSSLFIFSKDYLNQFVSKPGGLIVYAGNFLTQFYFSPVYGSLIVSLLLVLFYLVFIEIIRKLSGSRNFSLFFALLPACLLMILQSRIDLYAYFIPGFLLAVSWFLFSIRAESLTSRIIILSLLPLIYYVAGSFVLVYIGTYVIYLLVYRTGRTGYLLAAYSVLVAVLAYFLFRNILFLQPAGPLLVYPLFSGKFSGLAVYITAFSGLIILYPLIVKFAGLMSQGSEMKFTFAGTIVLIPGTIFLLFRAYDPEVAATTQVERLVFEQRWDEVIKKHEAKPASNIIEEYYYNLALSETGQLCSRMFFGSQNFGSMSLMLKRESEQMSRALYFYYCIGLVNEAHHLAYEIMVQHGYRPENIKMLIKTELINGHLVVAKRYIDVLKKTLHYNVWAKRYERMAGNPELISSDPELGEKQKMVPNSDFFIDTDDLKNVGLLLKVNPDNKKAFEYKIARLLFEKDLVEIGNEVRKMKDSGYSRIPRHIEEAIVALVNVTKEFPDLGGLSISPDTDHRFIQYFSELKSLRGDKTAVEKRIKKTERNTFWYYLQYGQVKRDIPGSSTEDNSIY